MKNFGNNAQRVAFASTAESIRPFLVPQCTPISDWTMKTRIDKSVVMDCTQASGRLKGPRSTRTGYLADHSTEPSATARPDRWSHAFGARLV